MMLCRFHLTILHQFGIKLPVLLTLSRDRRPKFPVRDFELSVCRATLSNKPFQSRIMFRNDCKGGNERLALSHDRACT